MHLQVHSEREDRLHNPSQDPILSNVSSRGIDYIEGEDQSDIHSQELVANDVYSSDNNTSEESQSLKGYTIKLGLGRRKGKI
jgi:hypothetical protein